MFQTARIFQFQLPLNYPLPLKGSVIHQREGLILELIDETGRVFYGECSPLPDFSRESLGEAFWQLMVVTEQLIETKRITSERLFPSLSFAIESAQYGSSYIEDTVVQLSDAPLLLGDLSDIEHRFNHWEGVWPSEFKLKVARVELDEDIHRVQRVLNLLPASVKLRLDANQNWTMPQVCRFASNVPVERISYIEEPTKDHRELTAIYQQTGLRVALDETVQNPGYGFSPMPGLSAIVIKPTLTGGICRCCELAEQAKQYGIRVVFSSSFESSLGVDIIRRLSASVSPGEAPGLDTLTAFKGTPYLYLPDKGLRLPESVINTMELKWTFNASL